ncbi:MAG: hypothetical protein ACI8X3_002105, partial [Saprospiraceae bacterium]
PLLPFEGGRISNYRFSRAIWVIQRGWKLTYQAKAC